MVYRSEKCVIQVIDAFKELLSTDRTLLVPIIGSIAELALPKQVKQEIVELNQVDIIVYNIYSIRNIA